jgi:hypothetical protein
MIYTRSLLTAGLTNVTNGSGDCSSGGRSRRRASHGDVAAAYFRETTIDAQ